VKQLQTRVIVSNERGDGKATADSVRGRGRLNGEKES
jgi:hypothetical protein